MRFLPLLLALAAVPTGLIGSPKANPIRIVNPRLTDGRDVSAQRLPLGIPNDDKPFLARLKSGGLLVVAFCSGPIEGVDGTLVSVHSFRGRDGNTCVESVRWRLPESKLNPGLDQ